MKQLPTRLLALLPVICLFATPQLKGQTGSAPANLNGFDGFVEQVMEEWRVPGLAVAIVKDGKVVYAKGYGYRDIKKELKATPDTLFAIGSCSKAFTATAMAILVDEGKLNWEKPLRDYLPDFRLSDAYATEHMRPRDLVTHQSGLPSHDMVWYDSPLTRRELYERLRYLEASKPVHAKFQWNNLMYMPAGVLIERITGLTWEEFVRRKILDPLGMKSSNFSVNDLQKMADYSRPYLEERGEVREIPFLNMDAVGPTGSINSSVNEMANWMLLQLGKGKFNGRQIISERSLREVHTPQVVLGGDLRFDETFYSSYAMGWNVSSYRGHPTITHDGGVDGFTSTVGFLPKDQLAVVVLTNSNSPVSALITYNAVDRMLGLSETPWLNRLKADSAKSREGQPKARVENEAEGKKDSKPPHALKDYTGQFEHPAYQTLTITQEGDQLKFDLHGMAGGLTHYRYDIFQATEATRGRLRGMRMTFLMNRAGEIDRVTLPLEPNVKDIVFTRKPAQPEKAAAQD